MFLGMAGWQHFRGDPAPGGQRQLYDAGHEASPTWCQPPGRFVSPADAAILGQVLADAEACRRERAGAYRYDCASSSAGAYEGHLDDLDQADVYAELGTRAGPLHRNGGIQHVNRSDRRPPGRQGCPAPSC